MQILDISRYAKPTRTDPNNGLSDIVQWLNDNVGKWDGYILNRTSPTVREGKGWSIRTHRNGKGFDDNPSGYAVITWHVYIEDDEKATLFALRW